MPRGDPPGVPGAGAYQLCSRTPLPQSSSNASLAVTRDAARRSRRRRRKTELGNIDCRWRFEIGPGGANSRAVSVATGRLDPDRLRAGQFLDEGLADQAGGREMSRHATHRQYTLDDAQRGMHGDVVTVRHAHAPPDRASRRIARLTPDEGRRACPLRL